VSSQSVGRHASVTHNAKDLAQRVRNRSGDLGKSLRMDLRTLQISQIPLRDRAGLVADKARAAGAIAKGGSAQWHLGDISLEVTGLNDLGTFQANLLEVAGFLRPHIDLGDHPVIVDVGANVGQFAAAALLLWPRASLRCFEPDPETFAQLERNLGKRPEVEPRCAAIGSSNGTLTFYRHELSVMSSLRADLVAGRERQDEFPVDVVTLDNACRAVRAIDLLKIDVEGFELEVLRGAGEVLRRTRYLYMEISLGDHDQGQTLDAFHLIREFAKDARFKAVGRSYQAKTPRGLETVSQDVLIDLGVLEPGG
jgi:FkbM family methyltransferase